MNLKIKDISERLRVSEKTVYRWIKSEKIPAYKINGQYRFNKQEIDEWLSKKKLEKDNSEKEITKIDLVDLISKGGFYNIKGNNIYEVIDNLSKTIKIPDELSREKLFKELINRENIIPTGIGRGIAIPHPHSPIIENKINEQVSICYLENPIEFNTIDEIPIHTLFIVLSADTKRHVQILSKLSFLCHEEKFLSLLKEKNSSEKILKYIMIKKKKWIEYNLRNLNNFIFTFIISFLYLILKHIEGYEKIIEKTLDCTCI